MRGECGKDDSLSIYAEKCMQTHAPWRGVLGFGACEQRASRQAVFLRRRALKDAKCRSALLIRLLMIGLGIVPLYPAWGEMVGQAGGNAAGSSTITLDVVVTDKAGKPVAGLEKRDFTLLDDGRQNKDFTVQEVDGAAHKDAQPAEAIIVLDAVNEKHESVEYARQQVAKFLRENDGHLAVPTSVFLMTDKGVEVQPRPTTDGNALAAVVDRMELPFRYISGRAGGVGLIDEFELSLRLFTGIVESEAKKPNRKLLIWIGWGWPMLDGARFLNSRKGQEEHFATIVELSRKMREGRMTLYSVSNDLSFYKEFLNAVKSPHDADAGNLSLKVLVTQSGGSIVSSGTDYVDAIRRILEEGKTYYRLTFASAPGAHAKEYHDLKVVVEQAGVTARTRTCYYAQP